MMLIDAFLAASRVKLSHLRPFSTSIKNYVFPELNEKDLEEHFVHGSGPGGQNVNKAHNCVFLKHIPTGLWVKVHDDRSIIKNREIARRRLLMHLDNHINGENSYMEQKKRQEQEILERRRAEKQKKRELKEAFKKMLLEEEEREKRKEEDEDHR